MSWPNLSVTGFTRNLCPAEVNGVSYQTGLTGLNGSDKKWKPFNENFLVPGPDPVSIFYWTCCLLLWAAEFALVLPIWKCWLHNCTLQTQMWQPRGQQPEQPCLSHTCSPAASPFLTVMPRTGPPGGLLITFPLELVSLLQRGCLWGSSPALSHLKLFSDTQQCCIAQRILVWLKSCCSCNLSWLFNRSTFMSKQKSLGAYSFI